MDDTKEKTGETPQLAPGEAENRQQAGSDAAPIASTNASDIGADLAASMPVPTSHGNEQTEIPAVNEAVPPSSAPSVPSVPAKPVPDVRDRSGKQFDPAKHRVDDLGAPKFNKNGFFISVDLGNPNGKNRNAPKPDAVPGEPAPVLPDGGNNGNAAAFTPHTGAKDQYDQSAELFLQVGYGLAASFVGDGIRPEFKVEKVVSGGPGLPDTIEEIIKLTPEGKQEHESLRLPLAAVLREKQTTGLTPTQMFLASLAAFVAKKAAKPTVRERFTLLILKVRSWFNKPKK